MTEEARLAITIIFIVVLQINPFRLLYKASTRSRNVMLQKHWANTANVNERSSKTYSWRFRGRIRLIQAKSSETIRNHLCQPSKHAREGRRLEVMSEPDLRQVLLLLADWVHLPIIVEAVSQRDGPLCCSCYIHDLALGSADPIGKLHHIWHCG